MAITPIPGWSTRVSITRPDVPETFYAVRRWSVRGECSEVDTSNSNESTPQYAMYARGMFKGSVTVEQATFDSSANLFATPLALGLGNRFKLTLYKNYQHPLNGIRRRWVFSLQVTQINDSADVQQLQPLTFSGVGLGIFTSPR